MDGVASTPERSRLLPEQLVNRSGPSSLPILAMVRAPKALVILVVLTGRSGSPVMLRARSACQLVPPDISELLPGYVSGLHCGVEMMRLCGQGLMSDLVVDAGDCKVFRQTPR
jgi:hypothetical protein